MGRYMEMAKNVIRRSDILLLLLDARHARESRNAEVESAVKKSGRPIIYVITKCDLVEKPVLEKLKREIKPSVFISAKERYGSRKLRERIIITAHRNLGRKEDIVVGVLGYPNVGKSSLINMLKGRHSAPTSSVSGYTKSLQNIKSDSRIMLIDTPGVIPYEEKDSMKAVLTGAVDFSKVKDPESALESIMKEFPGRVESHFGVPVEDDKRETIGTIALKKHMLLKGGRPDMRRASLSILRAIQNGKI